MKLIKSVVVLSSLFTIFSVEADSTVNQIKGEAVIIVDNKTYTLPLKKCYSATNTVDGKTHEAFIISTHQSRKSEEAEPVFSAMGSKTEKTGYSLRIDGGFLNGGTGYRGEMPYESFKDNKLVFEGKSNSIRKENEKSVKEQVPIHITVTCNG